MNRHESEPPYQLTQAEQLQQRPAVDFSRKGGKRGPNIIRADSLVRSLRGTMTVGMFGVLIGVSESAVRHWESNVRPLSLERFERMLSALNIPEERRAHLRNQIEGYPKIQPTEATEVNPLAGQSPYHTITDKITSIRKAHALLGEEILGLEAMVVKHILFQDARDLNKPN